MQINYKLKTLINARMTGDFRIRLTNYLGYLSCEGVIVIINNSYSYNKRELPSKLRVRGKRAYSYCVVPEICLGPPNH